MRSSILILCRASGSTLGLCPTFSLKSPRGMPARKAEGRRPHAAASGSQARRSCNVQARLASSGTNHHLILAAACMVLLSAMFVLSIPYDLFSVEPRLDHLKAKIDCCEEVRGAVLSLASHNQAESNWLRHFIHESLFWRPDCQQCA